MATNNTRIVANLNKSEPSEPGLIHAPWHLKLPCIAFVQAAIVVRSLRTHFVVYTSAAAVADSKCYWA